MRQDFIRFTARGPTNRIKFQASPPVCIDTLFVADFLRSCFRLRDRETRIDQRTEKGKTPRSRREKWEPSLSYISMYLHPTGDGIEEADAFWDWGRPRSIGAEMAWRQVDRWHSIPAVHSLAAQLALLLPKHEAWMPARRPRQNPHKRAAVAWRATPTLFLHTG